jgi:TolB protein
MTVLHHEPRNDGTARRSRLRRPRTIATLALLTALVVLGEAPAHATFPGPDGRIAFVDFKSGQIYAVNPDGTGLKQLTHTGAKRAAFDPSWSPNGKHVVFDVGPRRGGNSRIWIADADGADPHPLPAHVERVSDGGPTYTPSARQIVFERCKFQKEVCAIWKMRADGARKRPLTPYHEGTCCNTNVFDFGPSVSPDGKRIAFTRIHGRGTFSRVYLMQADGSDRHPVTPPRFEGFAPDWAPDGQRITFSSNATRTGSGVFTMAPDGSDIQPVTPDRYPHNEAEAAYSPGGDRIVFRSDRNYADICCSDLFAIAADGAGEQLIDTGLSGDFGEPAWGTAPLTP